MFVFIDCAHPPSATFIQSHYTSPSMGEQEETIAKLMKIPSVSEKCCLGMYLLGIREIEDLKGKNPDEMYEALTLRKDFYAEPCMQKMLKIAVGMVNKGAVK